MVRKKGEEHQRPCSVTSYIVGGKGDTNVRPEHPTTVGTTHLLIPRGLAHVSKGRAERFVSDSRGIFGTGLHLGRYGRKWLKPEIISPDAREKLEALKVCTYMGDGPDGHRGSHFRFPSFLNV